MKNAHSNKAVAAILANVKSVQDAQKFFFADALAYCYAMEHDNGNDEAPEDEMKKLALEKCQKKTPFTIDEVRDMFFDGELPRWARARQHVSGAWTVWFATGQVVHLYDGLIDKFEAEARAAERKARLQAEAKARMERAAKLAAKSEPERTPTPVLPPPPKKESEEQEPETLRSPTDAPSEERSGLDLVAEMCTEVWGSMPDFETHDGKGEIRAVHRCDACDKLENLNGDGICTRCAHLLVEDQRLQAEREIDAGWDVAA